MSVTAASGDSRDHGCHPRGAQPRLGSGQSRGFPPLVLPCPHVLSLSRGGARTRTLASWLDAVRLLPPSASGQPVAQAAEPLPVCTCDEPDHPPSLAQERGPPVQGHLLAEPIPLARWGALPSSVLAVPAGSISSAEVINTPHNVIRVIDNGVKQGKPRGFGAGILPKLISLRVCRIQSRQLQKHRIVAMCTLHFSILTFSQRIRFYKAPFVLPSRYPLRPRGGPF